MTEQRILPYRFPTTIILIDDNLAFLENLSFKLWEHHLVKIFNSPQKALSFFHDYQTLFSHEFYHPELLHGELVAGEVTSEQTQIQRYDVVKNIIYSDQRFSEVSTIVADYSMPGMNGVDLCSGVGFKQIRKIILTGEADNTIAVNAFNHGIINKFVRKDIRSALNEITYSIVEQNNEYFKSVAFAFDVQVNRKTQTESQHYIFQKTLDQFKIVEYYQVASDAFMLLDKDARIFWLVFHTEERGHSFKQIAIDNHAPSDVIEKLVNRTHQLYLFSDEEEKVPVAKWGGYLFPLLEEKGCLYSLIADRMFSLDRERIKSLSKYIAEQTLF